MQYPSPSNGKNESSLVLLLFFIRFLLDPFDLHDVVDRTDPNDLDPNDINDLVDFREVTDASRLQDDFLAFRRDELGWRKPLSSVRRLTPHSDSPVSSVSLLTPDTTLS